jgi:hypothetical protein
VKKPTVKYVIADVNMGLGHSGLDLLIDAHAMENKLFARTMEDGGLILFINTARDRAKLYEPGGDVIGYINTRGRKLTYRSLDLIPQTFGGSVEYSQAAKGAFEKFFKFEFERMKAATAKTQVV